MGKVGTGLSTSLDGFIAGPNEGWVYEGSPFTFVTDGVETAVERAKALAGDKDVGVGGANVAQRAMRAGLIGEVGIYLVPVLPGDGVRFFDNPGFAAVEVDRTKVVEAPGVTHLRFRVVE